MATQNYYIDYSAVEQVKDIQDALSTIEDTLGIPANLVIDQSDNSPMTMNQDTKINRLILVLSDEFPHEQPQSHADTQCEKPESRFLIKEEAIRGLFSDDDLELLVNTGYLIRKSPYEKFTHAVCWVLDQTALGCDFVQEDEFQELISNVPEIHMDEIINKVEELKNRGRRMGADSNEIIKRLTSQILFKMRITTNIM